MSSYWAGYSDTGMILTVSEFEEMRATYEEWNPQQKGIVENALDNEELEFVDFIMSKFAGISTSELSDNGSEKVFNMIELNDADTDGVIFYPFYRPDGRKNIVQQLENDDMELCECTHPIWDSENDRCYFLSSDKDMSGVNAFDEKPYASYQEFVQEFKDKVGAYLPDDFDWDEHLGNIYYAAYA